MFSENFFQKSHTQAAHLKLECETIGYRFLKRSFSILEKLIKEHKNIKFVLNKHTITL